MILKKESIFKKHDFEENFLKNKVFVKSTILKENFFVLSDFESTFFTTRVYILNNLPKSTTCTFNIVVLHITMYSYSLPCLRELDNSTRHPSNNTFCGVFGKDFQFRFRCGVPLSFQNLPDLCKNQLLLIVKQQQLVQFQSHTFLTSFLKGYDKMEHVNHILYQNTNTVKLIVTNFYRHNQEHFLFLFQIDDFSAAWEDPWIWQTRVLIEEEHSPCLPLRPTQWGFQTDPSIDKSSSIVGEKGVSMPGLNAASISNCEFSQLNSMSSRSDTW